LFGHPHANSLVGTIRCDVQAGQIRITPAPREDIPGPAAPVSYAFQVQGDSLTLTDVKGTPIYLQRVPVQQDAFANVQVELVAATGINKAGELLVTEFTELRTGRTSVSYFQPRARALKTRLGSVWMVQRSGLKQLTLAEARDRIRAPTPVVVAYRQASRTQRHSLWKESGPPQPDSEAASRTLLRTLRPGTLVFVLSARENVPVP
jgi:hypothetical protein